MQDKKDARPADKAPAGPDLAESGRRAQLQKQERQAAALRANLRRRKEQQRGRAAARVAADDDPGDSA